MKFTKLTLKANFFNHVSRNQNWTLFFCCILNVLHITYHQFLTKTQMISPRYDRTYSANMLISQLALQFQPTQVLRNDTQSKSIVLLGSIEGENAICTLEKTAFSLAEPADATLADLIEGIQLINSNDVYFWLLANLVQDIEKSPGVKVNFIYPASETAYSQVCSAEIAHGDGDPANVPAASKTVVETQKGDRIQWVYNILFKGKESETFIHHDADSASGFVLLPDMKWDRQTMQSMYLITIVNRTDISSVRDVDGSHVAFLEDLRQEIKDVVSLKFPVPADQLRLFVHYQPSYYHFHIHVVNVAHPGLGDGLNVGKAILLDDVIDNVKLMPDYYQRRTMSYQLGENHKLWEILKDGQSL